MKAIILSAAAAIGLFASSAAASVITLGGSHAEACYRAADARLRNMQAMQDCDMALNEEALGVRDRAGTLVNRGILHLVTNNIKAANRDFDAAIALNAREAEAWLNKSIAFVNYGNSAQAIPLAEKALELQTRRPALAYYVRGIAHEDMGTVEAAYTDLVRARDMEPGWSIPAQELERYKVRAR